MHKYVYAFVREDLSTSQQIIQTSHAMEMVAKRCDPDSKVHHMVLLSCKDLAKLESIAIDFDFDGIAYEMFYEPDIGQHTSIVTMPVYGEGRSRFKHYKLRK